MWFKLSFINCLSFICLYCLSINYLFLWFIHQLFVFIVHQLCIGNYYLSILSFFTRQVLVDIILLCDSRDKVWMFLHGQERCQDRGRSGAGLACSLVFFLDAIIYLWFLMSLLERLRGKLADFNEKHFQHLCKNPLNGPVMCHVQVHCFWFMRRFFLESAQFSPNRSVIIYYVLL